jgi:hypothetical protein
MTLNLDPTTPGTLAHDRWHKDDDARALARYEAYFTTSEYTHPHEVVDSELPNGGATRADARRAADGVGRVREPQHRTYENDEGLRRRDETPEHVVMSRTATGRSRPITTVRAIA